MRIPVMIRAVSKDSDQHLTEWFSKSYHATVYLRPSAVKASLVNALMAHLLIMFPLEVVDMNDSNKFGVLLLSESYVKSLPITNDDLETGEITRNSRAYKNSKVCSISTGVLTDCINRAFSEFLLGQPATAHTTWKKIWDEERKHGCLS